jgi:hypothetical protein
MLRCTKRSPFDTLDGIYVTAAVRETPRERTVFTLVTNARFDTTDTTASVTLTVMPTITEAVKQGWEMSNSDLTRSHRVLSTAATTQ